jgi:hypothetical protein
MEITRPSSDTLIDYQEITDSPLVSKTKDIALAVLAYGGTAIVFAGGIALIASQHVVGAIIGSLLAFCSMAYLAFKLLVKPREDIISKIIHKHNQIIQTQAADIEKHRHLISLQNTTMRGLHNELAEVKALHKDMSDTVIRLDELSTLLAKTSEELQTALSMVMGFLGSPKKRKQEIKEVARPHVQLNVTSEEIVETETVVIEESFVLPREEFLTPAREAVPNPEVTLGKPIKKRDRSMLDYLVSDIKALVDPLLEPPHS